jgi:antibiotic biosynthesis monooxygenase (ABM) superfamily enzyme
MTTSEEPNTSRPGARLARKALTTLLAWAAAYVVVNFVVAAGGQALAEASHAVQMLVISGVLVLAMTNVLMPLIMRVVARVFAAGERAPVRCCRATRWPV